VKVCHPNRHMRCSAVLAKKTANLLYFEQWSFH